MTGLPGFNYPAFHAAAERFRACGWEPVNPAENFDGRTDLPREKYLRADVKLLIDCDAVAMLSGWEDSRGAKLEYLLAQELSLPILDAETLKPMESLPFSSVDLQTTKKAAEGRKNGLPADSSWRKERPIARGVLDYFPLALAEVAHCSFTGNRQHNPGEVMHWAREKSTDHADCIVRHLIERGQVDTDGVRHSAKAAWRALAMLQTEIEAGPQG
jgi:hypothetical protein